MRTLTATQRRGRRRARDWAVAFHEAGHAAACFEERIRIRELSIEPNMETDGLVRHLNPLAGINLRSKAGDRAILKQGG